jgi:hypothetical protein
LRFSGYKDLVIGRRIVVLAALALAVPAGLTACADDESTPTAKASATPRVCPASWRPGWQQLANRVQAAVYCPTWMPSPLDGDMKGATKNGVSVKPDRSWLASFLWHEPPSQDVHVNFRAYPGRTTIPRCEDTQVVAGKVRKRDIPCFSDAQPPHRVGRFRVTPYTVNQGVDQWHVLYLWRERGSIYTVSQHVAKPTPYRQVVANLDRMMRGLVLVGPTA